MYAAPFHPADSRRQPEHAGIGQMLHRDAAHLEALLKAVLLVREGHGDHEFLDLGDALDRAVELAHQVHVLLAARTNGTDEVVVAAVEDGGETGGACAPCLEHDVGVVADLRAARQQRL